MIDELMEARSKLRHQRMMVVMKAEELFESASRSDASPELTHLLRGAENALSLLRMTL
jgi:hypothetical protein